jgi:nucleoside-diphosphate-sugar epimerase
MSDLPTAIPKGSWILVTGIAGFLASHITKQLLERGFKVRGTTRDPSAATWVAEEMFADANRRGHLEIVALDFVASPASAYEYAVQGVHGIIHVATIQTFDPNPKNVIPPVINSVTALLEAALREPTVKQFVYTSSSVAAFMPSPFTDEAPTVGRDSWNDAAVAAAWAPSDSPLHGAIIYMASKLEAEKTLWKFAVEKKAQFDINVVSPYTLVGPILHKSYVNKSLPGWINQLYHGDIDFIKNIPAREFRSIMTWYLKLTCVYYLSLLCQCQRRGTHTCWGALGPRGQE